MLKLVYLACLIGYVVSQPRMPPNPFGADLPENCDFTSLQQCLQPLMEQSAIMTRQADMGFTPPDVDTVCQLMTTLKSCVMPKLAMCGRDLMMIANATIKAVDYMCVDAKAETEEYYRCLSLNTDAAAQMSTCVNSFAVSQMDMASAMRSQPGSMDLMGIKNKLCTNLNTYEQCLENKAGYLCGEKAYVTKLFDLFNEGLRFLDCKNLGLPAAPTEMLRTRFGANDNRFGHRVNSSSGIVSEIQCVTSSFQHCFTPVLMSIQSPDVDQICSLYDESVKACILRIPVTDCKGKTTVAAEHINQMVAYLCGTARQDLKDSMRCFMREMPRIGQRCVEPMMSAHTRGDLLLESGRISQETKMHLCRAESGMKQCLDRHVDSSCGERANGVVRGLYPMYADMTNDLIGLQCPTDMDRHGDDSYLVTCFGPRGGRIMKIVLPIAGLLVLAIIIAITVAICRCRRNRRNLRKTEEKSDLVKNDLLQQNLRFAITQTPKEKDPEALKI